MKNKSLLLVILLLLVFALSGVSYGWQGRMGGMGDPYGLISDESDYLIHPAKIAKGEGIKFYGDYRFTYWGVLDRDVDYSIGVVGSAASLDMSGYELRHDALAGAAFPLGPGRMGVFFNYEGRQDDINGDIEEAASAIEPLSKLDDFALGLLYGLPLGGFRIGGEVGFAYRQEEHELFYYDTDLSGGLVNLSNPELILIAPPFVFYDSAYWEIPFRAGVEGVLGPVDVEFTLRGGLIVSGDNTWSLEVQSPVGVVVGGGDYDGDTAGWRIGGDLWVRYLVAGDLALPFLVRVDYREKTRDADGYPAPTVFYDYVTNETSLHLVAGGGLEKELTQSTRIAAGLYYSYLHDTTDLTIEGFDMTVPIFIEGFDHSDYPDFTEHRATVRLAGEHAFSPIFALRMGLECFYGWAMEDVLFMYYVPGNIATFTHSLNGSHWGIGASLGGTVKVKPFTLEPFFNVGYQSLALSGDGEVLTNGVLIYEYDRDDARNAWYIGGGLSILFNVP